MSKFDKLAPLIGVLSIAFLVTAFLIGQMSREQFCFRTQSEIELANTVRALIPLGTSLDEAIRKVSDTCGKVKLSNKRYKDGPKEKEINGDTRLVHHWMQIVEGPHNWHRTRRGLDARSRAVIMVYFDENDTTIGYDLQLSVTRF